MRLRQEQLRSLLLSTRETHDHEVDCDTFLSQIAPYAEARADERAIPAGLRGVQEHERLCATCREELATLVEMIAETKR
jgi:hypothetical protein